MKFLSPVRHPEVEAVRAAWQSYVDTGACPPDAVRPYVLRAWQRSLAAGCDARLARAHLLSPAETEALLREREQILRVSRPFLAALSRAAGPDRHAAMLADPDGRLLEVIGDPETLADEGFPRPGSLLSEPLAGANGVGTALAEGGYVELVGPEHFIEGFHAFTCQGVPLEGPTGRMGVLSMSVRRLETADRVRDILFCASEAAECELLARWLTQAVNRADEPMIEFLRQDMVQRITMARLRLEVAARRIAVGMDAGSTIQAALQLSRKFVRQAAVWRDLATPGDGPPRPEPVELADLADDLIELLHTEARVISVKLAWGSRADRVRVMADRRELSRRLLSCFLTAMQRAAPVSVLEVGVMAEGGQGRLAIEEIGQSMPKGTRCQVEAPLVSSIGPGRGQHG